MDFLGTHRPYRPDCYGKGLLAEVSRPFLLGEGIKYEGLVKNRRENYENLE